LDENSCFSQKNCKQNPKKKNLMSFATQERLKRKLENLGKQTASTSENVTVQEQNPSCEPHEEQLKECAVVKDQTDKNESNEDAEPSHKEQQKQSVTEQPLKKQRDKNEEEPAKQTEQEQRQKELEESKRHRMEQNQLPRTEPEVQTTNKEVEKRRQQENSDKRQHEEREAKERLNQLHFQPLNHSQQDTFHVPGCVIDLSNIPYKASTQDIINIFRPFNLTTNHVLRRYNDCGQPTDNARVCFKTPADARYALSSNKTILNRRVHLKLL
jgi:hypothetical protein